jgi:hypothetical protein
VILEKEGPYCNRQYGEDVCGPWGNGGRSAGWGSQGAWPARKGKGRAVGIRQWKGIDMKEMMQNVGGGLVTTLSQVYAQSTYHCALCINHHTDNHNKNVFHCSYCFRRINHLVVKHHLHLSSGVREVVSSTLISLLVQFQVIPIDG